MALSADDIQTAGRADLLCLFPDFCLVLLQQLLVLCPDYQNLWIFRLCIGVSLLQQFFRQIHFPQFALG